MKNNGILNLQLATLQRLTDEASGMGYNKAHYIIFSDYPSQAFTDIIIKAMARGEIQEVSTSLKKMIYNSYLELNQ